MLLNGELELQNVTSLVSTEGEKLRFRMAGDGECRGSDAKADTDWRFLIKLVLRINIDFNP